MEKDDNNYHALTSEQKNEDKTLSYLIPIPYNICCFPYDL